jgi:hypothetical protein
MPTPVEVSYVKRSRVKLTGIDALGGIWRDRPWSMSERNLIAEIQQPAETRQWNFYVTIDGLQVPIVVVGLRNGRSCLTAGSDPAALLRLPEMP